MKKFILIILMMLVGFQNRATDVENVLETYDKVVNILIVIKTLAPLIKRAISNEQKKAKFENAIKKFDESIGSIKQLRKVINDVQNNIIGKIGEYGNNASKVEASFKGLDKPDNESISKALHSITMFLKPIIESGLTPMIDFLDMPAFDNVKKVKQLREDLKVKFVGELSDSLEFIDGLAVLINPNLLTDEKTSAGSQLAQEAITAAEPLKLDKHIEVDSTPKETFELDLGDLSELGLEFE